MSGFSSVLFPLPPSLSMDEYADFVAASVRECNPAHAARQKEIEERIVARFSLSDTATPASPDPDAVRPTA